MRELTWAPTTSLGISQIRTHITYLILIITTYTAEETEALGSWLMHSKARDCIISGSRRPKPTTKAYVCLAHHKKISGGQEVLLASETPNIREKHLSFQREMDQERWKHIAFHKEKKSAFTAYVYINTYVQGCTESNIIRGKTQERLGLKKE